MQALSTYILCGGKSSRMGKDKALLDYNGSPFLKHIINAVTPISEAITLVSALPQHHQLGFPFIVEQKKEMGPVSAISTALEHTKSVWNLIISCDVPLIQTNFLEWLLAQDYAGFDALIGVVEEKKMPLVALYHQNCATIFKENLDQHQLKVMMVLEQLNINWVTIPEKFQGQLININTPKDLALIS